jgi:transcriptional regulator with XRE-family HTH domain
VNHKRLFLQFGLTFTTFQAMKNSELRVLIKDEYLKRKTKNPSYSIRAFSRDLGLSIGIISEFFNGKRSLSKGSLEKIQKTIKLPPFQGGASQNKAAKNKQSGPSYKVLSEAESAKLISSWLPYALLNVHNVKNHSASPEWLSKHFGVPIKEVELTLKALLDIGLIKIESQKIFRTSSDLMTSQDISSKGIRSYHRLILKKAEASLASVSVEHREFTAITLSLSKNDLTEVKNYIRKFRHQLAKRFSNSSADAIYVMSLQLFPLSKETPSNFESPS